MRNTVSRTALATQEISRFWCDGLPHSLEEFRVHLEQNHMEDVGETHISSAIYTAKWKGMLECIGRGIYKAGGNFDESVAAYSAEKNDMAYVLRKTQSALSHPINLIDLSPKERKLIPRLQELYQMCGQLLAELESEDSDNEISG